MGVLEKLGVGGGRKKRTNAPVEFLSADPLLKNICAIMPDGRCLIAQGYSTNKVLRKELLTLKRRKRISGRLHEETVSLEEIARVWGKEAQPIARGGDGGAEGPGAYLFSTRRPRPVPATWCSKTTARNASSSRW